MYRSRKELKFGARRALLGKYPAAVKMVVITLLSAWALFAALVFVTLIFGGAVMALIGDDKGIWAVFAGFYLDMLLLLLFYAMFLPGICRFYLNLCYGRAAVLADLFWGIRYPGGKFWKIGFEIMLWGVGLAVLSVLLTAWAFVVDMEFYAYLFVMLYCLLFTVGGIYLTLTYSLFFMILADMPHLSAAQALRESRQLMKGNRLRMVVLVFSFAGWFFMSWITMGLGVLWLWPYLCCTFCCFYLDLKEKYGYRTGNTGHKYTPKDQEGLWCGFRN